jgi:hypothetical protein
MQVSTASASNPVRSISRLGRERELDQVHLRHGVEDVQPDEMLGMPARLREPADRQRGRRGGQDGV